MQPNFGKIEFDILSPDGSPIYGLERCSAFERLRIDLLIVWLEATRNPEEGE